MARFPPPPAKAVGSQESLGFVGTSRAAYLSGTAREPSAQHQSRAGVIWVSITHLTVSLDWQALISIAPNVSTLQQIYIIIIILKIVFLKNLTVLKRPHLAPEAISHCQINLIPHLITLQGGCFLL